MFIYNTYFILFITNDYYYSFIKKKELIYIHLDIYMFLHIFI